MPRPASLPVLLAVHTGVQIVGALLVVALSFVLSAHDAQKLDAFVGLAAIAGTIVFAKLAQTRTRGSFDWPAILTLAIVAGVVCFALTYFLGAFAAHRRRDAGWAVVCGGMAFFEFAAALRLFTSVRSGRL